MFLEFEQANGLHRTDMFPVSGELGQAKALPELCRVLTVFRYFQQTFQIAVGILAQRIDSGQQGDCIFRDLIAFALDLLLRLPLFFAPPTYPKVLCRCLDSGQHLVKIDPIAQWPHTAGDALAVKVA